MDDARGESRITALSLRRIGYNLLCVNDVRKEA